MELYSKGGLQWNFTLKEATIGAFETVWDNQTYG